MTIKENEELVKSLFFEKSKQRFARLIGQFAGDEKSVLDEAETIFIRMLADMAYIDKTDHPMASSVFTGSATLAVYLAMNKHGVNVHDFGSAMLTNLARSSLKPDDPGNNPKRLAQLIASGKASQKNAKSDEYIFEAYAGDQKSFDWGITIQSCALCHAFSKHDAMNLVPYFCAMNDVISDLGDQGLRRTGTIALGAKQCVYTYKCGRDPKPLAPQYPDQIRFDKSS